MEGRVLSWSHYEKLCFKSTRHDRERCWERFAYPNLRIFKSLDGAFEAILGIVILVVFFLKLAFLTLLEKSS